MNPDPLYVDDVTWSTVRLPFHGDPPDLGPELPRDRRWLIFAAGICVGVLLARIRSW